jgi:hypothetical protein
MTEQKVFKVSKECRVKAFELAGKFSKHNDAFLNWIMEEPEAINR